MLRAWLIITCMALSAVATPVTSQQPGAGSAAVAPEEAKQTAADANQPEAPDPASQEAGDDSPFDYQSSEQISEDLSVSFPVDI